MFFSLFICTLVFICAHNQNLSIICFTVLVAHELIVLFFLSHRGLYSLAESSVLSLYNFFSLKLVPSSVFLHLAQCSCDEMNTGSELADRLYSRTSLLVISFANGFSIMPIGCQSTQGVIFYSMGRKYYLAAILWELDLL